MKTHLYFFIAILIGLFMALPASAQLYPVPLSQRIEHAKTIIKGKVITQKSYVDNKDDVYTANLVQVQAVLKGNVEEQIVVVTKGGEVEDRSVDYAHALWLVPGQEGYFFLIPSAIEPINDRDYDAENLYTYAGVQGFIQLLNDPVSKAISGKEPFRVYDDLPNQLLDVIEEQTGQKTVHFSKSDEYRSGIRYHFSSLQLSGNTLSFNIYANSLVGSKNLYQSGIILGYNPLVFGNNLGTNGNLQLYENGISSETAYDLTLADQGANKVRISLETVGSVSNLSSIDGNETLLAKGKLTLTTPFLDPQIVPDIAQSLSLNKWYDSQTGLSYPFDTVIIDIDFRELAMPIITKISPDTVAAGIGQIIEITGVNFGNYVDGVSSVKFTDAVAGPGVFFQALRGDIQYWDPTMIRVVVPTVGRVAPGDPAGDGIYAGTGKIQVCNDLSMCGTSLTDLFVKFAANDYWTAPGESPVDQSFPISLFGANDENGFYISFEPSFAADTAAVSCFMRALNTWKCATGLNYTTDPAHPNLSSLNTAVISYASLGSGLLGETAVNVVRCKSDSYYVQGYLRSLTIQFDPAYSWYKSQNEAGIIGTARYDLQSIALHELGHAHLLHHVNQSDHVMWWEIGDEVIKRKLKRYDIEGGDWIMDLSGSSLVGTTCTQLTQPMFRADTTGLPCSILLYSKDIQISNNRVKIYPNPTNSTLNISFSGPLSDPIRIQIFDVAGKVWLESNTSDKLSSLNVANLPNGLYIFGIQTVNNQSYFTKFVKQ